MPEISSKILSDEFEHILHNRTNILFERNNSESQEDIQDEERTWTVAEVQKTQNMQGKDQRTMK